MRIDGNPDISKIFIMAINAPLLSVKFIRATNINFLTPAVMRNVIFLCPKKEIWNANRNAIKLATKGSVDGLMKNTHHATNK